MLFSELLAANPQRMDLLSVEAQLLLQQDDELFSLSSQSHRLVEEEELAAEQPCKKPASERRRSKMQSKIPGCSTLSLKHRAMIGSGRARFIPARRQEVAKVRRLGACLRCRSKKIAVSLMLFFHVCLSTDLKVQCSEITPCKPCDRQKLLCHRQELDIRQIDPVPFSLRTVDIFATGMVSSPLASCVTNSTRSTMQLGVLQTTHPQS